MQTYSNPVQARTVACKPRGNELPGLAIQRAIAVFLAVVLTWSLSAGAQTQPTNMSVVIPVGTNNPAGAGAFSCNLSGSALSCTGSLSSTSSTDDIYLTGITFGGVTFDGIAGEIIPGLASVFVDGGGGTNVNAEWGDADNNDDGDDNPFNKAGYPIPPNDQESEDIDIINATLLQVFRTLNIMEGVDGEDQNFRLDLIFERGVRDDNGGAVDAVPEIIVFERGLNSDVSLQLLLADGGTSDELFVARADFRDAGFRADTVEIDNGQIMGAVGLDLNEFSGAGFDPASDTVIGVRFGSAGGGADIFGVFGTTKNPQPLRDRGDAPESYGTLNADNGPNHLLSRGLFIGLPPDSEPDGQPSADATGDDPIASDDEALQYQFPSGPFLPGDTFSVTVPVFNDTGAGALLCGWVDFNANGTFENADATSGANTNAERICATVADDSVSTGTNPDTVTLDFTIPSDFAGAPAGGLFAASGLPATGPVPAQPRRWARPTTAKSRTCCSTSKPRLSTTATLTIWSAAGRYSSPLGEATTARVTSSPPDRRPVSAPRSTPRPTASRMVWRPATTTTASTTRTA